MSNFGWLELFFDGMVGDDPGYNEVEWAVKEIGRLTVENEGMRKALKELAGICGYMSVGWSIAHRALAKTEADDGTEVKP